MKKYRVFLTAQEREALQTLVSKRSSQAFQVKRACVLLSADEGGEFSWTDEQIQATYQVSLRSIERTRQRDVEEGWQTAVNGQKHEVFKEKVLDGAVEAKLIALRCSAPPWDGCSWFFFLIRSVAEWLVSTGSFRDDNS